MNQGKPLEGKRILILEDDFYLAREERSLLEQAGAAVVGPFGTAFRIEGLSDLGQLHGAAIDINLGRGPSFDIAQALKQRGVPFVFVTGYDAAMIPAELADIERVEKPIRPRRFLAAVLRMSQFTAR